LTRKKHQKLELKRIENPVVQGDEIRLRQLFLNILENAIRYTEPKGIITLSVTTEATMAKIRITDTGIGITKADIEHIFEPFFRADQGRARFEGGTGLGLAIGQKIAVAHGGKIEVDSQEGEKGTSFSVFLPINPADQPAGQPRVARGVGKPGAISSRMHKLLFGR
jgi:signal transduction histidine kinase